MFKYLLLLKNPDNGEMATELLRLIDEGDMLTEEEVKNNIAKLGLLKTIGETEIYNAVFIDLLEDEAYAKHIE